MGLRRMTSTTTAKSSHLWASALLLLSAQAEAQNLAALPDDLTELPLEQLLMIEVTSVARAAQPLSEAPAAIQVIPGERLRQMGARHISDALRLAVGLQVARINGRSWAISSRGFNSSLSDKLEVRLDGRSLYTPLFSGVVWEFQDIPIELIDHIEIIRGPGAALWGANAINGVINIITRTAAAEDGTRVHAVIGEDQRHELQAEQSLALNPNSALRLFARQAEWRALALGDGGQGDDARRIHSLDVHANSTQPGKVSWRLNVNATEASMGSPQAIQGQDEQMQGAAINAQWALQRDPGNSWQVDLQADYFDRDIPGYYGEIRQQFGSEIRHQRTFGTSHDALFGLSYRRSDDEIRNSALVIFNPDRSSLDTLTVFAQDRIQLMPRLQLTLGLRLERNDFTGWETQPNARLAWTLSPSSLIWAAYSRAARAPNRIDRDWIIPGAQPGQFFIVDNDTFDTEKARFSELGLRHQLSTQLLVDVALFHARYSDMRGLSANENFQGIISNEGRGESYGLEALINWRPLRLLQLELGYSYFNLSLRARPGSLDTSIENNNQTDPRHQAWLSTRWQINERLNAELDLRYVGPLPDLNTPDYTELDVFTHWQFNRQLSAYAGGRNLLSDSHPEFNDGSAERVPRSAELGMRWSF